MASKKLTVEELSQLKYARQQRINYLAQLGNLELSILKLQKEKVKSSEIVIALEQAEQQLHKILQEKYGQGYIDIDNGEFIQQ